MNASSVAERYVKAVSKMINVVVVLLFNVRGKHLRSCRDGQLTLSHFLGRLRPPVLRACTFASN